MEREKGVVSDQEGRLNDLFATYRQACPEIDAGPEFMPDLWERIDARRRQARSWRWMASGFVTAAAAICLLLAALVSAPGSDNVVYTSTYVDALNDEDADSVAYIVGVAHSSGMEQRVQQ